MNVLPTFDPAQEKQIIVTFLRETFAKQHIENAVIGLSGGVDSATSFSLLREAIPAHHIYIMHLYYGQPLTAYLDDMLKNAGVPEENIRIISIKDSVEALAKNLAIEETEQTKIRRGNIAARVRMIMLFDYAKAKNALVCGTENKTENLLGYFTRFGDQASDVEPIEHLYKTYIYQLAKYLSVPEAIINQKPTAGLWEGQTDEGQFGFTYEDADNVLYLATEKNMDVDAIIQEGFANASKILTWREQNLFKHQTPYILK